MLSSKVRIKPILFGLGFGAMFFAVWMCFCLYGPPPFGAFAGWHAKATAVFFPMFYMLANWSMSHLQEPLGLVVNVGLGIIPYGIVFGVVAWIENRMARRK